MNIEIIFKNLEELANIFPKENYLLTFLIVILPVIIGGVITWVMNDKTFNKTKKMEEELVRLTNELKKLENYSNKLDRDDEFITFINTLVKGLKFLTDSTNKTEDDSKKDVINYERYLAEYQYGVMKYGNDEITKAWHELYSYYFDEIVDKEEEYILLELMLLNANLIAKVKNAYYQLNMDIENVMKTILTKERYLDEERARNIKEIRIKFNI